MVEAPLHTDVEPEIGPGVEGAVAIVITTAKVCGVLAPHEELPAATVMLPPAAPAVYVADVPDGFVPLQPAVVGRVQT